MADLSFTGGDFGTDEERASALMAPLKKAFKHDFLESKKISVVGAPFCDGQNLEGADQGPKAICDAGLVKLASKLGWEFDEVNHVDMTKLPVSEDSPPLQALQRTSVRRYQQWIREGRTMNFSEWMARQEKEKGGEGYASPSTRTKAGKYYDHVQNSEIVGQGLFVLYKEICAEVNKGNFLLTIGGDHSIAAASLSALVDTRYKDLSVIWVDAHADANTPMTSPSLHYHGMPAAHLLGWFEKNPPGFEWFSETAVLQESRFAFIGLRDIDPLEGELLKKSGVHYYTMRDVDELGIAKVIKSALNKIDPNNIRPLHLSLDIDAVDPLFAPGTGTLARGGLTYREIHYICEEMAMTNRLVSMDMVEINPALEPSAQVPAKSTSPAGLLRSNSTMHGDDPDIHPDTTPTVQLGLELILSSLGKTIMG